MRVGETYPDAQPGPACDRLPEPQQTCAGVRGDVTAAVSGTTSHGRAATTLLSQRYGLLHLNAVWGVLELNIIQNLARLWVGGGDSHL